MRLFPRCGRTHWRSSYLALRWDFTPLTVSSALSPAWLSTDPWDLTDVRNRLVARRSAKGTVPQDCTAQSSESQAYFSLR